MAILVGQGPIALPGNYTSYAFSQTSGNPGPGFPLRLGTTAKDQDGNVYVFCDFVGTVYGSQPVQIFDDYTAQALATTGRGRVGVACTNCTSDQGGWVQIYGRCQLMLGMSGVSPSDAANGPTTLSTSAATKFMLASSLSSPNGIGWVSDPSSGNGYQIDGIQVASDASPGDVSLVTSATSHTGNQIAVFLNYPQIVYRDITC